MQKSGAFVEQPALDVSVARCNSNFEGSLMPRLRAGGEAPVRRDPIWQKRTPPSAAAARASSASWNSSIVYAWADAALWDGASIVGASIVGASSQRSLNCLATGHDQNPFIFEASVKTSCPWNSPFQTR